MTAKTALCMAFLEGRILNVKNCFETIGLTNIAREVTRLVEKPFGVLISRYRTEGKNRYGQPIFWTNYRLNKSASYNQDGIQKMVDYIKSHSPSIISARTEKELKIARQICLL